MIKLPSESQIDSAASDYLDLCIPLQNNDECSWQVIDEAFKAGAEYVLNFINKTI